MKVDLLAMTKTNMQVMQKKKNFFLGLLKIWYCLVLWQSQLRHLGIAGFLNRQLRSMVP